MVPQADAATDHEAAPGYWCVVCGRWLPADETGFIAHDAIPHPTTMLFDDDEHPQ